MSTTVANGCEAVRSALADLGSMAEVARLLISAGRAIDLSGFEAEITDTCRSLLALDPAAAISLRPDLEALLRGVDRLMAAIARN